MRVASSLIVSLVLTSTISFAVPLTIAGLILGVAWLIGFIPGLVIFGHQALQYVVDFLGVFGDGKPLPGIITLGCVSTFVGIMLDLSNAYRYQSQHWDG